jgi:preprotein translocase subunit SecF
VKNGRKESRRRQEGHGQQEATQKGKSDDGKDRGEGAPQSRRNEKVGEVVSTKMQKTIVVAVEMRKAHTKYKRVDPQHEEVLRA